VIPRIDIAANISNPYVETKIRKLKSWHAPKKQTIEVKKKKTKCQVQLKQNHRRAKDFWEKCNITRDRKLENEVRIIFNLERVRFLRVVIAIKYDNEQVCYRVTDIIGKRIPYLQEMRSGQ